MNTLQEIDQEVILIYRKALYGLEQRLKERTEQTDKYKKMLHQRIAAIRELKDNG